MARRRPPGRSRSRWFANYVDLVVDKASVSKATRLSATEYKSTIEFTFTVGNDGYAWLYSIAVTAAGWRRGG